MEARLTALALAFVVALVPAAVRAQANVAVPAACTADVNAGFARLYAAGGTREVDNVMVCGTTVRASRTQYGSRVDHQVLTLRADLPGAGVRTIQIDTNDALDGVVSAPARAQVFAYGQFYRDSPRRVGLHDVHCSTHRGANNGWIVVNGTRFPQHPCPVRFR